MTTPKVAILLAVYNGLDYLEQQIESILNQVNVKLTIFVSVDKSTDGSEAWLDALALQEKRIIILPHGERFGGAAKNFFRLIKEVDFSAFDFVAFADQDDHWFADKLAKAITALNESQASAYSSNVLAFWPNGKQILIKKSQPQRRWDFIFEAAGPGCTYVLNVKLMMSIKKHLMANWDKAQHLALHDWYCYAFARAHHFKWYIDPAPSMLYRQHSNNEVGVNAGFKAGLKRLEKIKNGWWFKQAHLMTTLVAEGDFFIKSWSKLGRKELFRLATRAFQCRRQFREQLFFLLICIGLAILGYQIEIPANNKTL